MKQAPRGKQLQRQPIRPEIGIYLHWPFCQSKCPYCDFNSHVTASVDHMRWGDALTAELRRHHTEMPDADVSSIFFGGGTPSLMPAELVDRLLTCIGDLWGLPSSTEITLEANPSSVERARFEDFRRAGVNRISIGVQALDDGALRQLGRLHSAEDARRALNIALETFPRVSADLIYARQHQTTAAWERELHDALMLGTSHLSLYQLTIEDGTVFGKRHEQGRLPGLPSDDLAAEQYELTQAMCEAAGRPAYEISNHAVPGDECRHNLIYWRCGTFLGIGPGAHGRLDLGGQRFSTIAHHAPGAWLNAVETIGNGDSERALLPRSEIADEFLLMGIRLSEGVRIDTYEALAGKKIAHQTLSDLVHHGFIIWSNDRVALTQSGRLLANTIIARLATDPSLV